MIGTLAALAWLIASSVWGITPSSAATTMIAISVTRAPRPHRGERLVTRRVEEHDALAVVGTTSDAPMCWVMPPRSPAATSVDRMASSRLVLPWSTWPMTVTIGARGCSFFGSSSSKRTSFAASGAAPSPSASGPVPLFDAATVSATS